MLPHDINDEYIRLAPQSQGRFRGANACGHEQVRAVDDEMAVVEASSVFRWHHQRTEPRNSNLAAVVVAGKDRRITQPAQTIDVVGRVGQQQRQFTGSGLRDGRRGR
jgi:hypothetical protein